MTEALELKVVVTGNQGCFELVVSATNDEGFGFWFQYDINSTYSMTE